MFMTGACGGQKVALGPLELKLQMAVGWVLGTGTGPSARAADVLNHLIANSPAPGGVCHPA